MKILKTIINRFQIQEEQSANVNTERESIDSIPYTFKQVPYTINEVKNNFQKSIVDFSHLVTKDYFRTHPNKLSLDSFLFEAGRYTIENDKASIGMLQRTFKIGFNRAASIMDQLGALGVVSKEEGTKPRKVLMSMKDFLFLQENYDEVASLCLKNSMQYDNKDSLSIASPVENATKRIEMYHNKYDYMDGHDFEYFCSSLLLKNGFQKVDVTQNSNDQGIDIIAIKDGVRYGIQCKCYSSDIGNRAVQEAFAGAKYYDCHVPVVLTNRYFTRSAQELAEKVNVLLWDRDKLDRFIENIK